MLDVASVVSPSFFLARELYQCVSGEDYLTGRQLSPSERGVDAWLTLVYRVQPVSIALTAASERDALSGAARTLDDILEDETAFDRWLGRKFPADRPYPDDAAQKIWDRLRAKGLDPQLDEGHSFGVWRGPHIHIEKDNVHIPVSTTFKPK